MGNLKRKNTLPKHIFFFNQSNKKEQKSTRERERERERENLQFFCMKNMD